MDVFKTLILDTPDSLDNISGVLPVVNGGTGADNASDARDNLGLGTIATQDADAVAITGGSATGLTSLEVVGDTTLGSSNSDTVTFNTRISSELTPATDNTYDLGHPGHEWRNLYIDGTANIDSLVADTADINGNLTVDGLINTINGTDIDMDSSASGQLKLDGAGYGAAIALNAQGVNLYTNSASRDVIFGTDEVERMRIDGAGNVGVGTSAPNALLDVVGDAEINGLTVGRGSGNVSGNTASGYTALYSNTTGDRNTASGYRSLYSNTTGDDNTASGYAALYSNTTGNKNTASGYVALYSNTDGVNNTASGYQALYTNTTGVNNTALGMGALLNNTTGNNNAASGYLAGYDNTEGVQNTYLGYNTGRGITTGNYNTVLGANVTGLSATLSNNVIIADGQGNRRINIDGSGNVGIGLTAPSEKLELNAGHIFLDYDYGLKFGNAANNFIRAEGSGSEAMKIGYAGNVSVIIDSDNNSTASRFAVLKDSNSVAAATELMRVDESGNADITGRLTASGGIESNATGAAVGAAGLEVVVVQNNTAALILGQSNVINWRIRNQATTGNLEFSGATTGDVKMSIDSAGRVGIGTGSPTEKLTVSGSASATTVTASNGIASNGSYSSLYSGADLLLGGGAGSGNAIYTTATGSPTMYFDHRGTNNTGDFYWRSGTGGANTRMLLTSSGRLGVGTSSPDSKLHVATAGNNYIVSHNSAGSTSALLLGAESGSTSIYSWTTPTSNTGVPLKFRVGATESMRIDSSGNAMVSTTSINAGTGFSSQTGRLVAGNIQGSSGGFGAIGLAAANSTANFVVQNNCLLRVTIFSTNSSSTGRIGSYMFVGLNKGAGFNPTVLTLAETGSPQWSFGYTLNGASDTLVTVTAGADNQGARIIIEPLGNV